MEKVETARRRRSQRDYSLTFKLSVVEQVEQGESVLCSDQYSHGSLAFLGVLPEVYMLLATDRGGKPAESESTNLDALDSNP